MRPDRLSGLSVLAVIAAHADCGGGVPARADHGFRNRNGPLSITRLFCTRSKLLFQTTAAMILVLSFES